MVWQDEVEEIRRRRKLAAKQGGKDAVARQHAKGRLTLRERISRLVDEESFEELGQAAGASEYDEDGNKIGFTPANFILGFAKIDGRQVIVGGEDFTVRGGSPNPAGLRKSVYAEELACRYKVPLIRLHEGGGGSVTGAAGKKGPSGPVGDSVASKPRFQSVGEAMAMVPVMSAALGPVAGLPAARLAASHFTVMSRNTGQVLIAGPAVVERALGENLTKEELGGANIHWRNGVIDNLGENEDDALVQIRRYLSYLPQNVWQLSPRLKSDDDPNRAAEKLLNIVPRDRRKPYNMRSLIKLVVDQDSFFEFTKGYGRGIVTGFARLNGQAVGVFGNDCRFYAGAMNAAGSQKTRRFIETCETFHLPIVSFVDEPGFMIGLESEKSGTIRYGTSAVLAAAMCRVPWATVIVRRVFGVAGAAHFGPDAYVLAWPSAEVGALPVEGGVAVAFGREIAAAADPDAKRKELEEALAARQSPFPRSESFNYHELIDPRETRSKLCTWVDWLDPILENLKGPVRFGIRP